ncbi:MAG: HNH endonuclease [Sphingomonadaceae bacterium]
MEILLVVAAVLVAAFAYSLTVAGTKPVPGNDYYKVSKDGRVLLTAGTKVSAVRPKVSPDGLVVKLRAGERAGEFLVHHLVAEAHLPNPKKRKSVRHKDGNIKNNKLSNLEWC